MNFKKYYVSKNLFDGSIEQGSLNESSAIGTDYNNTKSTPTAAVNSYRVRIANPIYIDRELTLSIDFNNYQMYVLFYDENQQYTGEHSSSWRNSSLTLSGEYIGKYIGLAVKSKQSSTTPISPADDIKLMLNTGSSPLPYEPYSSEVWHDTPYYIHNTSTDTIATLPADLYPNDTTATVGLKGQTLQSSIPSPTSPVMPQGTGERTGNLFDVNRLPSDTWTIDDKYYIDGAVGDSKSSIRPDTVDVSISNSGDLTVTARSYYGAGFVIPVTPNTTYTISFTTDTAVPSSKSIATITYVNADEDFLNYITIYGDTTSVTFTTPDTAYYILITFRYTSNTITYSDIMLSSTALPYEPYGYKIPISSANTTTPVYLGEVHTTRKVKKYECTGDENWRFFSDSTGEYGAWQFYVDNAVNGLALSSALSNIAEYGATASTRSRYPYGVYLVASGTGIAFQMAGAKDIFPSVTAWKFYLAQQYANGTPVTVWYVLANEETAVVNEPLRKIGDYADEVSGITIPTIAGANALSVDTTLQPSEVSVNYHGWHPVADVHEYDSNYTIATMQALTIAQLQTHTISELQGGEWS